MKYFTSDCLFWAPSAISDYKNKIDLYTLRFVINFTVKY